MRYSGQRPRRDREYIEATHEFLSNQPWAREGLSVARVRKALAPAKVTNYEALIGSEARSNALFQSIAEDEQTVRRVIAHLAELNGRVVNAGALESFKHELIRMPDGFMIGAPGWDTLIGREEESPISWGNVLGNIFEYSLDLQLAANLSSDVIVADEASELAVARIDLAIQRATYSADQISSFEELVFDDAKFFAGAVNDGSISVHKALSLVEKSGDLRKWTSGLSPTSDLAKEYVQAVSAQETLEGARASLFRFFSFTGGGVLLDLAGTGGIGTAAGVALSAFDQFLLKRLFGGWRPNTFANRLKRTLS